MEETLVPLPHERRAAPRISYPGFVVVVAGGHRLCCQAVDLSATGMSVVPPAQAPAGTVVAVAFEFEQPGHWTHLQGTIVREAQIRQDYVWGIRFSEVPDAVAWQLQQYVHNCAFADLVASVVEAPVEFASRPVELPSEPVRAVGLRARRVTSGQPVMRVVRQAVLPTRPAAGRHRGHHASVGRSSAESRELKDLYQQALQDVGTDV